MRRFLCVALAATLLFGACKNDSESVTLGYSSAPNRYMPPPPPSRAVADLEVADPGVKSIEGEPNSNAVSLTGSNTANATEKKIIKEGSITFETNDLKAARKTIIDSLKKLGGYVSEEREQNDDELQRKEYTLSTRIPAQSFERFLSTVTTSADHIESKTITVKDVTTQFIDVTTRLNNQKLLENRYKELLQKSTKMADVLEVENKLNEIRTNIESTQGQLNYLNKQIAFSSLEITFFLNTAVKGNDGDGFGYKFKNSLRNSWQILENIFFGTITLWPVILLIAVIVWLVRLWWRRKKRRKEVIPE